MKIRYNVVPTSARSTSASIWMPHATGSQWKARFYKSGAPFARNLTCNFDLRSTSTSDQTSTGCRASAFATRCFIFWPICSHESSTWHLHPTIFLNILLRATSSLASWATVSGHVSNPYSIVRHTTASNNFKRSFTFMWMLVKVCANPCYNPQN